MKRIIACLTAVSLCFGIASFPAFAEETGSGMIYYYSDMSGESSLKGATTTLHERTPASFKKDSDGTDYMKFETIDGTVKTNYSFLNLPIITNTDDVKPDVVFEMRLRNNMNSNSLITTRTNTHAFMLFGTNIRRSYYSPEYAEGVIGTYSYNTWNTITIVYRGAEDRREIYLNGVHLADSLPGYANSGGAYNNWYQNGRLDLQLWFYLAATGYYADIDYVKIYKLPESLDVSVANADATELDELYLTFNAPVNLTKEMITLSAGAVEDVSLWDKENNIWRVVLSGPLDITTGYEVIVSGATDMFGNTVEKTLSFTTRDKVFDTGAASIGSIAEEYSGYASGAAFLGGSLKNELEDEMKATVVVASYDANGKSKSIFSKEYTVPKEDNLTFFEEIELPSDGVLAKTMIWQSAEAPVPMGDMVSYGEKKNVEEYKNIAAPFGGEAELNLEIITAEGEEESEKLKAELTLSGAEREFLTGILVKAPDGSAEYMDGLRTTDGKAVFEIPLDYTKIGKYTVLCGVEKGNVVSGEIDYYSPAFIEEKTEEWINSETATADLAADFVELLGEYMGMDIEGFGKLSDKERVLTLFLGLKAISENGIFNSDDEIVKAFSTAIAMEMLYEGKETEKLLLEDNAFELPEKLSQVLSSVISPSGMEYLSAELEGEELMLPSEVVEFVKKTAILGGVYKAESYMQVSGIITAFGEELGIDTAGFEGLKTPSAVSKKVMNKVYDTLEELSSAVNKLITERKRAEASAASSVGSGGGGGGGGGSAGKININTVSPEKEENKEENKEEIKEEASEEVKISFTDVKKEHWFYDDVMWAAGKKLFIGTDTGAFLPEMNLTLEHIYIVLKRMGIELGSADENYDVTREEFAKLLFDNLCRDESFADSKKWIETKGIFKGDEKGDMMYDKPLTRAQCCTVLRRLENEEI